MTHFIKRFIRYCGSKKLAWLLVINVAVFVTIWVVGVVCGLAGISGNPTTGWLCVPSSAINFLYVPWTLVTYMFVQYDFWHVLFNVLWLYWFGTLLLTTLSGRHLLFLYLGGGIAGGLLFIIFQALFPQFAHSGAYLCGASAAVLAIIVSVAIRTPDMELSLFLLGSVKVKWIALVCIILTFVGVGGGMTGSQAAHVGGLIFGISFSLALKRGIDLTTRFHIPRIKPANPIPVFKEKRQVNKKINVESARTAMSGKLSDVGRLDSLLDKIRTSGYDSLTSMEKKELNALSRRLEK